MRCKHNSTYASNQRGFTMVELLVTLVIAAFVSAGMFNLYLSFSNSAVRQDQVLAMQQNARVAMDDLERDIRMAGVDVAQGNPDPSIPDQAVFAYAAPYELIFNANLDNTLGGILPGAAPSQVPNSPVAGQSAFYSPGTAYALAETVRWTLDGNDDGVVDAFDRMSESATSGVSNPSLYRLTRQVYGLGDAGNNGPYTSTSADGVRGPDAYPDGSLPPVLFQFWINELDLNDNDSVDVGEDINGNGIIDTFLWGDDGGSLGTASLLAGNGKLDPEEILSLMTGNGGFGKVLNSTEAPITAINGDARATALTLAQALSNVNRVVVNTVTETTHPDPDYLGSPHGPDYKYREQSVVSSVTPRNDMTDITSDMQLTISANPSRVQCPDNTSTIQVRLVDATGSVFTSPTQVTVTTSMGWFSPSNTPSATVTTSNGTAIFSMVGDNQSSVSTAVINATATVLSKQYSAATNVDFASALPATISLNSDLPSLPADGLSQTLITASLKDACNKKAGDGSTLSWAVTTNPLGIGGTMNPPVAPINGSIASGTLTAGTSGGLAIIAATEAATGLSSTITVSFTSCSLQVSSAMPAIPADGASNTTVSFVLLDSSGVPQPGVTVEARTDAGTLISALTPVGTVVPAIVVTDANGAGSVTVISGTTPHTAAITISVPPVGHACDFTQGRTYVDFSDCGVVITSDVSEVTPGSPGGIANITATVLDSITGNPLGNQNLTFALTETGNLSQAGGSLAPLTVTTNGAGQGFTAYVAGSKPGVARVGVSTACGVSSVNIFVRNCLVSVNASPPVIAPSFGTTTTVSTILTDSITGVPLSGRSVTFSVDNPLLADFTTPVTVVTDATGTAVVTLRALGNVGVVNVTATSDCGTGSAVVLLNDWQIQLTSDAANVTHGGVANLTATLLSGGVATNPQPGDDLVTLSFDAPGGLGSTLTPLSTITVGGVTQHVFVAGTTTGLITVRASATIAGVLITTTTAISVTDPPSGLDPLILDSASVNSCKSGERVAFTVQNVGLDNVIITSVQFTWTGGGKIDKVKTEGQTSDCKGGSEYWNGKKNGCGKADGRQNSPATLTEFCKDATIDSGNSYTFNQIKIKDVDMRGETLTAIITTEPIGGGQASTSTITFTVP